MDFCFSAAAANATASPPTPAGRARKRAKIAVKKWSLCAGSRERYRERCFPYRIVLTNPFQSQTKAHGWPVIGHTMAPEPDKPIGRRGARRTYTSSGRGSLNILTRAVHRPLSIKTRGGPGYAWVLKESYCASSRHQPLVTPRMVSGGPCRGGSIPLWSMALARLSSPSVYHGCGGRPEMALRDAAMIVLRRELSRMKCRDDLREARGD